MKGIVICGFLKCGTTSLLEYLKVKYKLPIAKEAGFYDYDFEGKISRREWCYLPYKEQMERFHKVFGKIEDFQLVYITREPVERVWSGWESWRHYYKGYSFEEYLNLDSDKYSGGLKYLGEVNPIMQVQYDMWIEPFRKYDPIVFKLEEVSKEPGFPQTNSLKTKPVPQDKRKLIEKYLNK